MIYTIKDSLAATRENLNLAIAVTTSKKFSNFSTWFDNVIADAKIADTRYPVRGFIVYRENGTHILSKIRDRLEQLLEETGHLSMLFPIATTSDIFSTETEHIKGFEEEVYRVEKAGEKELDVKLVMRPTSETCIYPMFKLWVRLHSDLPLKIHQSVNVYRHETKPMKPLLRAREIPWNEAHTAHESSAEADEQVKEAISIYSKLLDELGIAYLLLKRPDFDRFPGAKYSIAFDAWNPDGRVNQVGSAHNLSRNFSKVFGIEFEEKDGTRTPVHQTRYGLGYSRVLAALIAQHGDDRGCVFPAYVAPLQTVVIPLPFKEQEEVILGYSRQVYERVKGSFRAKLDDRPEVSPGEKCYYWEVMGIPTRIEVGPQEVMDNIATIVRRDTFERLRADLNELPTILGEVLVTIARSLRERNQRVLQQMISRVFSSDEAREVLTAKRVASLEWCGSQKCADELKEKTGGELRGTRYDTVEVPRGNCAVCRRKSEYVVYLAKAY